MQNRVSPQLDPPPVRTTREPGPGTPPTQTRPERRKSDGWFTRVQHRIKLAMEGDDEDLLVSNHTPLSWHIYHKYHLLGILDPGETRLYRLRKNGNLNARPWRESDPVDYLVITLTSSIQRVEIYPRQMGSGITVYDMRVGAGAGTGKEGRGSRDPA